MKDLGYGKNYKFIHYKEKLMTMNCLPKSLENKSYYVPTKEGNKN